jgi:arylsulfatase A-like enzyme
MNRNRLLAGLAVLFAAFGQAQAKPSPPNIVLIVADDLGYGQLGSYGQKQIRTPHLDRLAAEGTRFTQFYAGHCVCAPSRCVLMTGYHTGHCSTRVNGGGAPLLDSDITLAEVLKGAGYATGCFGKWGLGDHGTAGVPNRQGFDEFFGYLHQVHAHFYYPSFLWRNDRRQELKANWGQKSEQYSHDLIADGALDFIRRHRSERFFLYVPFTIPHFELLAPEDSMKEYRGQFPEPRAYKGDHYASQPEPRTALAAMISRMDRDVGRILDLLKKLALDRDTLVLFTSDNGGYLLADELFRNNGPLRGGKGSFYEGGIRVPLLVRWPGRVPAGATDDLAWAFWDVLPTLAELANAKPPAGLDGAPLAKRLLGEKQTPPERFLYWETQPQNQGGKPPWAVAARRGNWKALRQKPHLPLELYDLGIDIGETRNVAKAHPEVVKQFEAFLKTARTTSRTYPVEEPLWKYEPLKTGFVR